MWSVYIYNVCMYMVCIIYGVYLWCIKVHIYLSGVIGVCIYVCIHMSCTYMLDICVHGGYVSIEGIYIYVVYVLCIDVYGGPVFYMQCILCIHRNTYTCTSHIYYMSIYGWYGWLWCMCVYKYRVCIYVVCVYIWCEYMYIWYRFMYIGDAKCTYIVCRGV